MGFNSQYTKRKFIEYCYNKFSMGDKEIEQEIWCTGANFAQYRKLLQNLNINLKSRIMFLNSLVRSRIKYGCHVWHQTRSEIPTTVCMQIFSKINGLKYHSGIENVSEDNPSSNLVDGGYRITEKCTN